MMVWPIVPLFVKFSVGRVVCLTSLLPFADILSHAYQCLRERYPSPISFKQDFPEGNLIFPEGNLIWKFGQVSWAPISIYAKWK